MICGQRQESKVQNLKYSPYCRTISIDPRGGFLLLLLPSFISYSLYCRTMPQAVEPTCPFAGQRPSSRHTRSSSWSLWYIIMIVMVMVLYDDRYGTLTLLLPGWGCTRRCWVRDTGLFKYCIRWVWFWYSSVQWYKINTFVQKIVFVKRSLKDSCPLRFLYLKFFVCSIAVLTVAEMNYSSDCYRMHLLTLHL